MKKIMLGLIFLSVFVLTSCVSFEYRNLPKTYTRWSSVDEQFMFDVQGLQKSFGIGYITTQEEQVEVFVYIDVIYGEVHLFHIIDEELSEEPYLIFDIEKGSLNGLTMTLITLENHSNDESLNNLILEMSRRDLTNEDNYDAKYYLGSNWMNKEIKMVLIDDVVRGVSSKLLGYMYINDVKQSILFIFKDNQSFDIKLNGEIILSGTYETDKDQLTLIIEVNEIEYPYDQIILYATYESEIDSE